MHEDATLCIMHMYLCVFVRMCGMCIPDCSGAEGGRGTGGNVGVVLGVQLIINSILQGDKKDKTDLCQHYCLP